MIGPGKAFDTNKYFVICSNVLGGCRGTTGPGSLNPATGCPYAMSFPVITIGDMVRLQKMLIDSFGIQRLLAVSGGSMGGMQALEWAAAYPQSVVSAIPIATTTRHSAQQIAFNEVGRQAIMADPDWADGNYYDKQPPARGLAVARMGGHITYMSDDSMREKFDRRVRGKENFSFVFDVDFEVESYLRYRGSQFVYRFDANSYLYITKAMDYFDLTNGHGTLAAALEKTQARFLVISFSSDWLYPSYQSQELVRALGCGEGELLEWLASNKGVDARGVEISGAKVQKAIARGVSVFQSDIDEGLADYPDQAFDYVILSQTLQETRHPSKVLRPISRGAFYGMVFGMATTKITITLQNNQLEEIRALIAAGAAVSVSAFVKHAVGVLSLI